MRTSILPSLHVYLCTAQLDHQTTRPHGGIAINLAPSPPLITSFLLPCTVLCLSLVSFYQPPHMLCWHVACCVYQLVNARCTAADKDQKDITNNRLLTGERDTQVPPRKAPHYLTPSTSFICPALILICYCCQIPPLSSHQNHEAAPQQDPHTALPFFIIIIIIITILLRLWINSTIENTSMFSYCWSQAWIKGEGCVRNDICHKVFAKSNMQIIRNEISIPDWSWSGCQ